MSDLQHVFRAILGQNIGNKLTPELALGIEHSLLTTYAGILNADHALINFGFEPHWYSEFSFNVERMETIAEEISVLHKMHWDESESVRHGLPYQPNYQRWIADERSGNFMLFTVRHQGALVGYCQVYITTSNHTGVRICNEDALFLHPDARKGRVCAELAKYGEACVKELGVREIRLSVKTGNDIWKLWERMGYVRTGYELVKVLGD